MYSIFISAHATRLLAIVAAVVLGLCGGTPPSADQAESLAALKASAEQGDAKAQFNLGVIHDLGQGVPENDAEAVKWYTKAAEQDYAPAQRNIGIMYRNGEGLTKNKAEALKWFTKAAVQGDAQAQDNLGNMYRNGEGVPVSEAEAVKWVTKAAEQGDAEGQCSLGYMYSEGLGVPKDEAEAVKWYTKAAKQGHATAQFNLSSMYGDGLGVPMDKAEQLKLLTMAAEQGEAIAQWVLGTWFEDGTEGVPKDEAEAVKWYIKAAEQGESIAQTALAVMYFQGKGTPQNNVLAYSWSNIDAASGSALSGKFRDTIATRMTADQIAEAQRISGAFKPKKSQKEQGRSKHSAPLVESQASGSGFFITRDGYFVTNHHVIAEARRVQVRTASGKYLAEVVRVDAANDLALLKVAGTFAALHVRGSVGVRSADRVATIGYPNPDLQGLASKFSSGEVAALTGPGDDPTLFQISVSIQPGNSGGPLVDASGSVVGVVVAQLDKIKTLKTTGSLPENVNYAIKGTILLGLLESVPGLAEKLQPASKGAAPDLATVAKEVEAATGMVLVDK